jgi:hypothetical protein
MTAIVVPAAWTVSSVGVVTMSSSGSFARCAVSLVTITAAAFRTTDRPLLSPIYHHLSSGKVFRHPMELLTAIEGSS